MSESVSSFHRSHAAFDVDLARDDLAQRVFAPSEGERIGFEMEFLPLARGTSCPVPLPQTLTLLREHADRSGWSESVSPYGAPRFTEASGGTLTFEPGGQLEWSSEPLDSVDQVLAAAHRTWPDLLSRCCTGGVTLVSRGIDPVNPVERTRLWLQNARYERMDRYLNRWAPYGARMMRQTAACHVNLDFGADPGRRWRAATALVPYAIAIFANSARYGGRDTGHRSFRAHQWRRLEPARTGLLPAADPQQALLRTALSASDFLGAEDRGHETFGMRMARGSATRQQWEAHLSTFFHEVRPRGYLEFRAIDSLPPRWFAAPMTFLVGLLYDEAATERVLATTQEPTPEAVAEAGRRGLAHPELAAGARVLFRESLEGAARLGSTRVGDAALTSAEAFYTRFTERGLDPGSDQGTSPEDRFLKPPRVPETATPAGRSERGFPDHRAGAVPLQHRS